MNKLNMAEMKCETGIGRNIFAWLLGLGILFFAEAFFIQQNPTIGKLTTMPAADISSVHMENETLAQQFVSETDRIEGFLLRCDVSLIKNPADVEVVFKYDGEVAGQWLVNRMDVRKNYLKFVLDDPIEGALGHSCEIWVSSVDESGILVNLSSTRSSGATNLFYGKMQYTDRFLCYSLIEHKVSGFWMMVAVWLFTLAVMGGLYFMIHGIRTKKVQHYFAYIYVVMGIIQLIAIPIFKTPDELNHFFRSYEISMGYLTSEANPDGVSEGVDGAGRELPVAVSGLMDTRHNYYDMKWYDVNYFSGLEVDDDRVFVGFGNTALYAALNYLPQALGIFIVRIFSGNVLAMAYGARIFNWLASGIIVYLALAYLPVGKRLALLITLLPMNMQQFNSMSPDALVFAVCLSLVSFVLYQRCSGEVKGCMRKKDYLVMYLLVFALCQCKVVYVPLCLLLFLIPAEKFGTKKKYVLNIFMVALLGTVIFGSWTMFSSKFLTQFQPGVDSQAQIGYVLTKPLQYLMTMFHTIDQDLNSWLQQALGFNLGWLTINTSFLALFVYGVVITYIFLVDNDIDNEYFDRLARWMLLGVSCLIGLLVCTSLYVQWTAYALNVISGIQGRYFVPVLFPLLLALKPDRELFSKKKINGKLVYPIVLGVNLIISTILITNAL